MSQNDLTAAPSASEGTVTIALAGALGRMGQALARTLDGRRDAVVVGHGFCGRGGGVVSSGEGDAFHGV